jgi:hypothetical protein
MTDNAVGQPTASKTGRKLELHIKTAVALSRKKSPSEQPAGGSTTVASAPPEGPKIAANEKQDAPAVEGLSTNQSEVQKAPAATEPIAGGGGAQGVVAEEKRPTGAGQSPGLNREPNNCHGSLNVQFRHLTFLKKYFCSPPA